MNFYAEENFTEQYAGDHTHLIITKLHNSIHAALYNEHTFTQLIHLTIFLFKTKEKAQIYLKLLELSQ